MRSISLCTAFASVFSHGNLSITSSVVATLMIMSCLWTKHVRSIGFWTYQLFFFGSYGIRQPLHVVIRGILIFAGCFCGSKIFNPYARRLSTSYEWSLTWNGEGTETHSWCCTVPLFVPSLTMVALCMAQQQTPTYDNWTAFITLDGDWHLEHSAPAQCPVCTQRPTKLLWRNVG